MIDLKNVSNKAFGKSLNSAYLRDEVKISLPQLEVQKKIFVECKKVDKEYNISKMTIEKCKIK